MANNNLSDYGYALISTIDTQPFGILTVWFKRDSEELWLQRLDGSLKLLGGGGGGEFYYTSSTPPTQNPGARWLHSSTGILYTLIYDGFGYWWMQAY